MDDKTIKTDNAILNLLLEQQEIEEVKQEVGLVPGENGYEIHAGKICTSENLITLRNKAQIGLGSTKFAGFVAEKYDGLNSGQLVFDADGYARVGDEGDLQMIATREDAPIANGIAFYDKETRNFKTKKESTLWVANSEKLGNISASRYLRNDINNPKISVNGELTFALEANADNANESDQVSLLLVRGDGETTASLGLNNSNDLYLNHGSSQVFKYDESEDDILFNSTVHASAKFNKTVLYSPDTSSDIMNLRRYGNDHTILNVWSPPQSSWGGAKESTLSLVRGDENEYFMDIYNMDYGQTDQGNYLDYGKPEMGIRLQKRGSGSYTPFYIEYGNGSETFKAIEIEPNETNTNNHSSVKLNRLIANFDGINKFETTAEGTTTNGNSTVKGNISIDGGTIHSTGTNTNYDERHPVLWGRGKSDDTIVWQTVRGGFLEFSSGPSYGTNAKKMISLWTGTRPSVAIGASQLINDDDLGLLKLQTNHGSIKIGAGNSSLAHFYTDRSKFYFNKGIAAVSELGIYNTSSKLSNKKLNLTDQHYLESIETGIKHWGDAMFTGYTGTEKFVDGFSGEGWRTDQLGNATFDRLTVRKDFNVYELNVNKIRSGNGSYWFSDGMKYEKDYGTDENYYRIGIDLDNGNLSQPFKKGDIVRCQVWTGRNIKYYTLTIDDVLTDATRSYFRAPKSSKTGSGIPETGDELVRIGNISDTDRQGAIYITSTDSNAPYIDVLDDVTSDSFDGKTKVRLGKLDGITSPTFGNLSGYGFWTQNGYLEGGINASHGKIGNWTINEDQIKSPTVDGGYVELHTGTYPRIQVYRDANNRINFYQNNSSDWGIYGKKEGQMYFQLGSVNQIAGWNFTDNALYTSTGTYGDGINIGLFKASSGAGTDSALHKNQGLQGLKITYYKNFSGGDDRAGARAVMGALSDGDFYRNDENGKYGFELVGGRKVSNWSDLIFRASISNVTGELDCRIAGWKFDHYRITSNVPNPDSWNGETLIKLATKNSGSGSFYSGNQTLQGYSMMWHRSSNAGHIVMGQVAASGSSVKTNFKGIQMMSYVGEEYFCLSANVNKTGGREVYNRIAGWSFDSSKIWSGNIELNSSGLIRHTSDKWKLNSDGSGRLANGNISWDANGNTILDSNVKLKWGTDSKNLIDWSEWSTDSSGSTEHFNQNGSESENVRVQATLPDGRYGTVWECRPDVASGADGGWNTDYIPIDNSYPYRYSVWVKRSGDSNGSTYHGTRNVVPLGSGNVINSNPYFWSGDTPTFGDWYLLIGYIHPAGYTGGNAGISGIYDINGNKIVSATEWKWSTSTTTSYFRSYLYYCTNTSNRQQFYNPMVHKCDGTEPSIADLVGLDAGKVTTITKDTVTSSYISGLNCTFNKGTIGGWNINSSAIYSGKYQGSNAYTTKGITIHKDGAIRAKNFRIDTSGNAYFRGEIESKLGTIGGFTIGSSYIQTSNYEDDTKDGRLRIGSDGSIRVQDANYSASIISSDGILSNHANTQCVSLSTGIDWKASIVALGFGNKSRDQYIPDRKMLCGLYASVSNSASATSRAPSYAAYLNGAVYSQMQMGGALCSSTLGFTTSSSGTELKPFQNTAHNYNTYYCTASSGSKLYVKLPRTTSVTQKIPDGTIIRIGTMGRDIGIVAGYYNRLRWDSNTARTSGTYTIGDQNSWVQWILVNGAWTRLTSGNY